MLFRSITNDTIIALILECSPVLAQLKHLRASNHHKDERKGGQRSSNCGLNQGLAFQSNPQMKEQSLFDCIFLVSQIYLTNPLCKACDLLK